MSDKDNTMNVTDKEVSNETGGETKERVVKQTTNKVQVSPSAVKDNNSSVPTKLTSEELATLDYADFSTPARMIKLGEVLVKSALVPLKKPEDVVTALMTGKELGLPFITSLSQIYPINGRPTLGVHIQKALLLKAGVTFKKIEDAVEIFEYVEIVDTKPIKLLEGTLKEQPKGSKKKLLGFRTTYEFNREIKRPSGKYVEINAKGSFSTMEAAAADLLEKDVWKKYYKRMLDARAFTNGAREIADDILFGIYSPNELSNNYYINSDNEEVHIPEVMEGN